MWNVLCILIESGRSNLWAFEPIFVVILNGPIFFQSNFFDDHVVWILRDSNHLISPDLRFGLGFLW